jgi:transposase
MLRKRWSNEVMAQENSSIPKSISEKDWRETPASVCKLVFSLIERVEKLEKKVRDLEEEKNKNSKNSSNPPSSDGPTFPPNPKKKKDKRKKGGQPGHKGVTRKLVPIEEVDASYDEKPGTCGKCGHGLSGEDEFPHRHQVSEIPPVIATVTEYRLHTLSCPSCGNDTRAELPLGVPKGAFGPRLQAMVALFTGRYHLSKRDTAEILEDFFRVPISLGSITTLERRTSKAIASAVEKAREYVKEQVQAHMDETGWYEKNKRFWMWVASVPFVTVFLIRKSRGGKVVKEMIGEKFAGILNSDRWSAYNWLPVSSRQLCWAHLKRDFQAFIDRGGGSEKIGKKIKTQMDLMFDFWQEVKDGTMSFLTFQSKMEPVQIKVGELLREGTNCEHKKTAGTCRDILKREAALWTFVHKEGIEPTNNIAEQKVRPGVLWRKVSFGTQSDAGSRFAERTMTAIATLKQQERNVLDYFIEACHAANSNKPAPSLIPEAYT